MTKIDFFDFFPKNNSKIAIFDKESISQLCGYNKIQIWLKVDSFTDHAENDFDSLDSQTI